MGGKSKKVAFKKDLRNIKGNMKETEGTSQEHKRTKVQTNETQGKPNEDLAKGTIGTFCQTAMESHMASATQIRGSTTENAQHFLPLGLFESFQQLFAFGFD